MKLCCTTIDDESVDYYCTKLMHKQHSHYIDDCNVLIAARIDRTVVACATRSCCVVGVGDGRSHTSGQLVVDD